MSEPATIAQYSVKELAIWSGRLGMALTLRGFCVKTGRWSLSRSFLWRSNAGLEPCYHLVEHHLAREPTVQRLCGIEAPCLEQLVGRCSASAPAEVGAGTFTRFYALLDFVPYKPEFRGLLDIREPVGSNVAEYEITEPRVSCS